MHSFETLDQPCVPIVEFWVLCLEFWKMTWRLCISGKMIVKNCQAEKALFECLKYTGEMFYNDR